MINNGLTLVVDYGQPNSDLQAPFHGPQFGNAGYPASKIWSIHVASKQTDFDVWLVTLPTGS